jgi:hypothetical protein
VAWELNYRGALDVLRQAWAQQARRPLVVADGWRNFLHGWTQALSRGLGLPIDGAAFERLGAIAARVRRGASQIDHSTLERLAHRTFVGVAGHRVDSAPAKLSSQISLGSLIDEAEKGHGLI